jgi:predicted  nucleic acid-binding Zn ribbon protein
MKSLAETQDVSPAGCCGYITFDEMSIQVIIQYRTLNTNRKIHQAIILFIENWQALHAQVKCLVFM